MEVAVGAPSERWRKKDEFGEFFRGLESLLMLLPGGESVSRNPVLLGLGPGLGHIQA